MYMINMMMNNKKVTNVDIKMIKQDVFKDKDYAMCAFEH